MPRLTHNKCFVFFSLAAVALILCLSLVATSASANPGISLTPFESIKADVTPGETITHQIRLSLGEQDRAMDMAVDVMGFGSSADGSVRAIEIAQDTSPYSARSFISVDERSFHLEPGGAQGIIVTIVVPSNVGGGGRYAVIYIHQQQPAGAGGAGTLSAFNIPVLLTIKGSALVHTGEITELAAGQAVSGQPIEIFTSFQNTGNHHFKIKGEVTVSNSKGEVLDTISTSLTSSSIIPTMSWRLRAAFISKGALAAGVYSVKSKVMLEDGTILDEKEGSFELGQTYTPPSPPTTPPPPPLTTPAPAPTAINWPIIGGAIAAVIIMGLLIVIFFLVRRRAS